MSVMTICHVHKTREQVHLYSQRRVQVKKLSARFFGKIYALVSVNARLSKAWDKWGKANSQRTPFFL